MYCSRLAEYFIPIEAFNNLATAALPARECIMYGAVINVNMIVNGFSN